MKGRGRAAIVIVCLAVGLAAVALIALAIIPRISPLNVQVVLENRTDQEVRITLGREQDPTNSTFALVPPHNSAVVLVAAPPRDGDYSFDWVGRSLPVTISSTAGTKTDAIPADWNPWHTYRYAWCGTAACP